MAETVIDIKQALQIARAFNLAFNNAFMYGGSHQTTRDSAVSFFTVMQPLLAAAGIITISVERGSVYIENHCVDKLVSVPRITSRFTKTGVQSVSFDKEASPASAQALFYLMGALSDIHRVEEMQAHLAKERISGLRINYVVYQKVTVDEAIINKNALSGVHVQFSDQRPAGTGAYAQVDPGRILRELAETLSLRSAAGSTDSSGNAAGSCGPPRLSQADYDEFLTTQLKSINDQLASTGESVDTSCLTPAEMLETVYKLKENVLENIRIQKETGKLAAADELAISEINQISYQVIVRLIKEEYRGDRNISVKRLAQIIRRMLPDIKELRYLLPQLKDGLFAEGMSPSDYLSLVKELSKELSSDELVQVMVEASDQIGLTLNELIEGIKEVPEEAARLIVLAAEIKKGGVRVDDTQMSEVLSDYIEKVSRVLALQSPEAAAPGGGAMLKSAVTRIEREILERLKSQDVGMDTVKDVAQKLVNQFNATVSSLKGDWVKSNVNGTEKPDEETLLSIIEQVAEHRHEGYEVTDEIRAILLSSGYSAEKIDSIVEKARLRAASAITHALELTPGTFDAQSTQFFLDHGIKLNLRFNTPFSTMLLSYEKIVDLRTFSLIDITPDVIIQLTNQSLKYLKDTQRFDTDIIGLHTVNDVSIPFLLFPMTDITGAHFIKKRIDKEFPCHEFLVDGITVHVEPTVTVSGFNKKQTPDMASYLEAIYRSHCRPKLQ